MSRLDRDLDGIMNLLNEIQVAVGGKQEKKKKGAGNTDRFNDLKGSMIHRMAEVRELIGQTKNTNPGADLQPREIIAMNAQIRENMRQLQEDVDELQRLHQKEAKKRRSKFSNEELQLRGNMLAQMQTEIQQLKEMSLAGYVKNYNNNRPGALFTIEESDAFKGPLGSMPVNTDMSEDNRLQLKQIQQRDKEMDAKYLDQIEKGVGDLKEIAMKANEQIKTTNVMLDNLEEKIISVQDKLDSVNVKMKHTLDEVGRRSDKLCIDIVCIIIMLGMVGVLYRLISHTK